MLKLVNPKAMNVRVAEARSSARVGVIGTAPSLIAS